MIVADQTEVLRDSFFNSTESVLQLIVDILNEVLFGTYQLLHKLDYGASEVLKG